MVTLAQVSHLVMRAVQRGPARQQPQRWVGLDLGSQSIKLVELERAGASGWRLVKCLVQDLPLTSGPVDRLWWLQAAFKEVGMGEVHASVGGPQVTLRRLPMPPMPKRELPEALKWQLKDHVTFPIQDAVLDVRVIGEVWEKDIKKQDVLVAAAPRSLIQELMTLTEQAGCRLASLSPSPCAVWRCAASLLPGAGEGSVAVVEIGAAETQVTIAKEGQIRLVRNVVVGGAALTEALVGVIASEQGEIAIDPSKAEALKRRYGILDESAEGTTDEGVPLFHLSSLMRPVLEHLLTEISRVLDFYKIQMDEAGVSRVILCGGGANVRQLKAFLAEALGVPVEVFNPLVRIPDRVQALQAEQVAEGTRLAEAIGLAMDHGQGLNLLPPEARRTHQPWAPLTPRHLTRAAQAVAAAALALWLGLQLTAAALQRQIRAQEAAWATLASAVQGETDTLTATTRLETLLERAAAFLNQQPVWDGVFKGLGDVMPSAIELDELAVASPAPEAPHQLYLKGRVISGSKGKGSIGELVQRMERSVFFAGMELVTTEMRAGEAETTSFELEGRLE